MPIYHVAGAPQMKDSDGEWTERNGVSQVGVGDTIVSFPNVHFAVYSNVFNITHA
jgi:hypothetical protein